MSLEVMADKSDAFKLAHPSIDGVAIGVPIVGADGRHLVAYPWAHEDVAGLGALDIIPGDWVYPSSDFVT